MNSIESAILSYLSNSLWQVPLVFAAGALSARILRTAGPRAEHRVWVITLLASSLLPGLSLLPLDSLAGWWPWQSSLHPPGDAHVSVQMGPGAGLGGFALPPALLQAIAAVYILVLAWFAVRFLLRCAHLPAVARDSTALKINGGAALALARCAQQPGMPPVTLASSPRIFSPLTMGLRRVQILLPHGLEDRLAPADLRMVIAHECAHIRRHDFLKNLLYELVSLPVAYHPVLWLTRQHIAESREMVCDQAAAEFSSPHEYAQSLLRLAAMLLTGQPRRIPHVIGIFDANTLERRLVKLTQLNARIGRLRRAVLVAFCIAFGVAACTSALALRTSVDPTAAANPNTSSSDPHSIPPEKAASHVKSKVMPVYPPEAKKARIQGKVVLDAIIGKTGDVEHLSVVSGPKELQQSALDAVRQWTYDPFLLNGEPVEVKTTINITYSLQK